MARWGYMTPICILVSMFSAWTVVAIAGCWVAFSSLKRQARPVVLHYENGVCRENGDGAWRYLKYIGLRRELGKTMWPADRNRILTAEAGAFRPERVDVYYWLSWPIWERPRRGQGIPADYSFRYAVISMAMAAGALALASC